MTAIAAKRRNADNPWFKRGTLFRAVLDALRTATEPMTADEVCAALLKGKTPAAAKRQEINLQAAVLALLRKRMAVAWSGLECSRSGGV